MSRFKYFPMCGDTEQHPPHNYNGTAYCAGLTQFEKDTLYPDTWTR